MQCKLIKLCVYESSIQQRNIKKKIGCRSSFKDIISRFSFMYTSFIHRLTTCGTILVFSCYFLELAHAKTPKQAKGDNDEEDEHVKGIKEYFDVIKNYKTKHKNGGQDVLEEESTEIDTPQEPELKFTKKFRNNYDQDKKFDDKYERQERKVNSDNRYNKIANKKKYKKEKGNSEESGEDDDNFDEIEKVKITKDESDENNSDEETKSKKKYKNAKKLQKSTKNNGDGNEEDDKSEEVKKNRKKDTKKNKNKSDERDRKHEDSDESQSNESREVAQACRKKSKKNGYEEDCEEVPNEKTKKIKYSIKFAHEKQKTKVVDDDYILKKIHREHKRKR